MCTRDEKKEIIYNNNNQYLIEENKVCFILIL